MRGTPAGERTRRTVLCALLLAVMLASGEPMQAALDYFRPEEYRNRIAQEAEQAVMERIRALFASANES